MEKKIDLMLEPLKQYVIDRETDLSDAIKCFNEIKDKIIDFENILSRMLYIRSHVASKIDKIKKSKILKKDKTYKNSVGKKAADKKQASINNKGRIKWRYLIVKELEKNKRLSTAQLLQRFSEMGLIPKNDGHEKKRITQNARSAIGWCSTHGVIKQTKDGNSWELDSKAI